MPDGRANWVSRHDHTRCMVFMKGAAVCSPERTNAFGEPGCGQTWYLSNRGWQPEPPWSTS